MAVNTPEKSFLFCSMVTAWLVFPAMAFAGHGQAMPAGSKTRNPVQDLGEIVVVSEKIDAFIQKNPTQVVSMGAGADQVLSRSSSTAVLPPPPSTAAWT